MIYLTKQELERYDRQLRIFGIKAQERLKSSKVTIVGLGGLGCALALYLTAAGIGTLKLIDREKIELSNLNRQILHWTPDIGKEKTLSALEKLEKLNPEITIETLNVEVDEENVHEIVKDSTLVLDALDNWKTRFLLNKECVRNGIPLIHAGVREFQGQVFVIKPGEGPCLRCLFPQPPKEEEKIPVVGAVVALIAMIQAVEALKLLTGWGKPLIGTLLFYDGIIQNIERIRVRRNPDCPVCGARG